MKQTTNPLEEFFGAHDSAQLSSEKERLRDLAQSREMQALAELLRSGGGNVEDAANAAIRGDTKALSYLLKQVSGTPEGARVVETLKERFKT